MNRYHSTASDIDIIVSRVLDRKALSLQEGFGRHARHHERTRLKEPSTENYPTTNELSKSEFAIPGFAEHAFYRSNVHFLSTWSTCKDTCIYSMRPLRVLTCLCATSSQCILSHRKIVYTCTVACLHKSRILLPSSCVRTWPSISLNVFLFYFFSH